MGMVDGKPRTMKEIIKRDFMVNSIPNKLVFN